jgi:hypothetical protein
MVGYRFYILDAEDHIVQAFEIECANDAKARLAARQLLAGDPYHRAVEVWERTRRLMKIVRDVSPRLRHGNERGARVLGPVN